MPNPGVSTFMNGTGLDEKIGILAALPLVLGKKSSNPKPTAASFMSSLNIRRLNPKT